MTLRYPEKSSGGALSLAVRPYGTYGIHDIHDIHDIHGPLDDSPEYPQG